MTLLAFALMAIGAGLVGAGFAFGLAKLLGEP